MKTQPDRNHVTLLVVRDAERPVRQFRVNKPLALALPAAAVLSITGLVASMQVQSSRAIAQLEAEAAALTRHGTRMEQMAAEKDASLRRLRTEVSDLSQEAESIKDKMKAVSALEAQLQQLINKQNGAKPDEEGQSGQDTAGAASAGEPLYASSAPGLKVGGEYIAVYASESAQLVKETKDDFAEIDGLIAEMIDSVSRTIDEAEQAEAIRIQQAAAEKKRLEPAVIWPTPSKVITSSFGYRTDPFKGSSAFHSGIDIAGRTGDPIYAAKDGVVKAAEQQGARGKYVIIDHGGGLETWYLHLNAIKVSEGQKVNKGQPIGTLGNTGRSTGPHLHFQVVKNDDPVNPLHYVQPN